MVVGKPFLHAYGRKKKKKKVVLDCWARRCPRIKAFSDKNRFVLQFCADNLQRGLAQEQAAFSSLGPIWSLSNDERGCKRSWQCVCASACEAERVLQKRSNVINVSRSIALLSLLSVRVRVDLCLSWGLCVCVCVWLSWGVCDWQRLPYLSTHTVWPL